ncbi:MAG: hypothetical protein WKG00_22830 [Polyangiaceae bacterium]
MPALDLETYAFVRAGLIDGLPLAELLEARGIDAAAWERGATEWREALLDPDDARALELSLELERHSDEARRAWRRRVEPLDSDLRAWLGFVRVLSSADDPLAVMGAHGIDAAVMAGLHRGWAARMRDEPSLMAEAAAILDEPPVRPAEVRVSPVRWVDPAPRRAARRGTVREGEIDLDGTALGVAVLRDGDALPFQDVPVTAASVLPSFSVPLPRRAPGAAAPRRSATTGGAGPSVDETLFLKTPIEDETLPFLKADAALPGAGALGQPGAPPDLDGTAPLAVLAEEAPALPFAAGAPSQVLAGLPAAAAKQEDPGSGTMLIPTLRDEDEDEEAAEDEPSARRRT